ncbi:MAG: Tryptophan synthase alpha chain [Labilithrix sp.]|nr:Tryptophan synthase alpha chain [Labilithrix sp.]
MRTIAMRLVLTAAASMTVAALTGCTADAGAGAAERPATAVSLAQLSVGTRGELPVCDAASEATVAYVADEKKLLACIGGSWTDVVFQTGATGATGATGPAGGAGIAGQAGIAGSPGDAGVPGVNGTNGAPSLIKLTTLAMGDTHCAFGGLQIDVGVDGNHSGALDAGEITQTAYVCAPVLPVRPRLVFTTSQTFDGNLGGIAGADAKCQAAASTNVALAGKTFRAWLSDSVATPTSRLAHDGAFVRLDGVQVAASWFRLLSSYVYSPGYTLDAPFSIDESGAPVSGEAWTGTGSNGLRYGEDPSNGVCGDWTDASDASIGLTGWTTAPNSGWTAWDQSTCSTLAHLYCFEE